MSASDAVSSGSKKYSAIDLAAPEVILVISEFILNAVIFPSPNVSDTLLAAIIAMSIGAAKYRNTSAAASKPNLKTILRMFWFLFVASTSAFLVASCCAN